MSTYRITDCTSAIVLGEYLADSPEQALEIMAQDAGYDSYADAVEAIGSLPAPAREELQIEEI